MMIFTSFRYTYKKAIVLWLCCFFSAATIAQDSLSQYILTPKPGPEPRINGPRVFGVRPNHPVLFTIPVTGDRPITFSADDLPKGLKLDAKTGRLSGSLS